MNLLRVLLLLACLGRAAAGSGQEAPPPGGHPLRLVAELRPIPLPPGGLWPYRQGTLWGFADTTGRVWVQPQHWELPSEIRQFWGEYVTIRPYFREQLPAWLPPTASTPWKLWLNAHGEVLVIHRDEIAIRQPDGSVRAVPARRAVGQPRLREPQWEQYQWLEPAPPLLSAERVEVYEGDPDNWRELNKPRYRVGELGEGRWKVAHSTSARKYYRRRQRGRFSPSYSAYALFDEWARRRTPYRFDDIEDMEQGVSRVSVDDFRVGLLSRQGRLLLRPRYQYVTKLRRGLAVARRRVGEDQWRTGIIDSVGRWCWRPHAGWLSNLDAAGLVRAGRPNPASGPISFRRPDGSVPFANHTFHRAGPFWQGRAWVEVASGQQGLIDEQGRWVTPARYDLLTVADYMGAATLRHPTLQLDFIEYSAGFNEGLDTYGSETYFEPRQPETPYLLARRDGHYGFVDWRSGAEVVPCRYDSVLAVPEVEHRQYRLQPYACAWRQGRPYVLNMRGQELAEGYYTGRVETYPDGPRLLLRRPADSTWAAIDTTGRLRTAWLPGAARWDGGWLLPHNRALVRRGHSQQLLDALTGRVLLTAPSIELRHNLRPAAALQDLVFATYGEGSPSQYFDEHLRPLRLDELLNTQGAGAGWLAASRFPNPSKDANAHLLISPEGRRLELPAGNSWDVYYPHYRLGPFPGGVGRTKLGYLTRGGRQLWQD